MKQILIALIVILSLTSYSQQTFKEEQNTSSRVRQAYAEKEVLVKDMLRKDTIAANNLMVYLRVFKTEEIIELWAKNETDDSYTFIKTYDFCQNSGTVGPKRKKGDMQIPEGFYYIDRFNFWSKFYLSLGLNYPNFSDKILGFQENLGSDIFIHGACATVGCIPITDDKIKELYVFCVEAKNNGQNKIPVRIFPMKLTEENYDELKSKYATDKDKLGLWEDLKNDFDHFEMTHTLSNITFLENGRHKIGH